MPIDKKAGVTLNRVIPVFFINSKRRGGDLNSREPYGSTDFRDRRFKPNSATSP